MKNQNENTTQTAPPTGGEEAAAEAVDVNTLQDLQAENAELKTALRLSDAREQLIQVLAKAGARSPALLFESAKSDLQFADDGTLANSAAIVERLAKAFPEQFGSELHVSIDGGAGGVNASELTKDALAKMKPAEIAALDWDTVRRALGEH